MAVPADHVIKQFCEEGEKSCLFGGVTHDILTGWFEHDTLSVRGICWVLGAILDNILVIVVWKMGVEEIARCMSRMDDKCLQSALWERIDNLLKVYVHVLVELLVTHLSQHFMEYLSSMGVSCFRLGTFLALHPFCLKVKLVSGGQTSRHNTREIENSLAEERVIPPSSIAVMVCMPSRIVVLCSELYVRSKHEKE